MTIGNKIRILRQSRNMTQKDLAAASGLAEITIRQYEADKFKPKPEQIEKLAKALNISSSEINTENFWKSAEGNITVRVPNYLEEDFNYFEYKKEKEKNLNFVIKAIKKRDFQSDLIIDIIDMLLSMNPEGQGDAYKYIIDIVNFPKYQKELPKNNNNEEE